MNFVVLLALLTTTRGAPDRGPAPAGVTAITHVSVVDVVTGRILADQTVLIDGRKITRVGPAGTIKAPAGANTVDGRGKWLIPGMWDMHTHVSIPGGEELLALYPLMGVTGIREMNDSFPQVVGWRKRIAAGDLVGPRIIASGPYLVGQRPPLPHYLVRTPEQGRAGVDSLKQLGVDFVKVHNGIPREAYFAIAARVKELGWVYAGHVPQGVSVAEAADAGQRSLEHFTGFHTACTDQEAAAHPPTGIVAFLLGPCDQSDLAPTIARLKANGTWVDPTLVVQRVVGAQGDSAADSTARYRSEALRQLQTMVMRLPPMSPEAIATATFLFRKRQELLKKLADAGVSILAGSDAPTPGTFPGFGLHDELGLMVDAGLTPLQALQAATIEPAKYFRGTDSLGTVAPGRLADLVLLDGNPLENIANTRRLSAVWAEGRLIDQNERRRLLEQVAAAAKR